MCVYICHNILCTYECAELCCLDFLSIFLDVFLCVRQVYICAFVCLEAKLLSATNKSLVSPKKGNFLLPLLLIFLQTVAQNCYDMFFSTNLLQCYQKAAAASKNIKQQSLNLDNRQTRYTQRQFQFFLRPVVFFFLSSLMCRLFVSVPVDELDGDSTKATPKHGYSPM